MFLLKAGSIFLTDKVWAPLISRYSKIKSTDHEKMQEEHDDIEEITFFDDNQDNQMNDKDTEDMDTRVSNNPK